jgi:hypothetical protein
MSALNPEIQYLKERKTPLGAPPALQRKVKIRLLGKLGHFHVWLVDGPNVRRLLDTDFIMGSHFAHSRFIPEGEVWVEKAMGPRDLYPLLVHELVELYRMVDGWSYERGHDLATKIEKTIRAQDTFTLTRAGAMRRAAEFLARLRK